MKKKKTVDIHKNILKTGFMIHLLFIVKRMKEKQGIKFERKNKNWIFSCYFPQIITNRIYFREALSGLNFPFITFLPTLSFHHPSHIKFLHEG